MADEIEPQPESAPEVAPESAPQLAAEPASPAIPAALAGPAKGFAEVWAEAALRVIQDLSGDRAWMPGEASPEPNAAAAEICAHLEFGPALAGKQQIKFHRATLHAWAGLALPADQAASRRKNAPLDEAEQEALAEVVKRLAAAAAAALDAAGWGPVPIQLRHVGPLRRTVEPGGDVVPLRFVHPRGGMLELELGFDRELHRSLERRLHPEAAEPDPDPAPEPAPDAPDARGGAASGKLDLLLDVELDVTLRFGGRQMLLHDVLELAPGSVLELDRHIDDPVELLVGGKIVAWGDVVVVDGNYGLRVSRLVHRRERMAALEMAR
ncbi:MAG TPA: FliM/FliN family flagellar motor C-terminal domain-containing protein [Terriglobales bacterium]|nr:FliM/FliN family flagellar motor C-terminal domain-containing protein [Terriglobales bacterium]